MKKSTVGLFTVIGLAICQDGAGQILLSKGTYTQNFDSLSSTQHHTWTDNKTLPGWYARRRAGKEAPYYGSYRVSDGSTPNGWIYSFGSETNRGVHPASDRAFGTICSSSPERIAFGARFLNDTSNILSGFTISYTGEQWRNGSAETPQTLTFGYRTSQTPLTNSEPDIEIRWKKFPALNFVSPVYQLGMYPLDGNSPGNRKTFTRVAMPGVRLNPGEELFIRWLATELPAPAGGLAVDDFKLEAFAEP